MPLIGKSKNKDKQDNKPAKQQKQDRFMRRALNARFPDTRSNDVLTFDFTEAFSEKKLKIIGAATDRIALGRGEFDKLYQLSKDIARQYTPYISGDQVPDQAKTDEMIDAFERLDQLASAWLDSSEAKWDRKGNHGKDKITRIKEIEARGMRSGARTTLFQLKNRDKLESDETARLMAELDQARDQARSGRTADAEAYRAKDAELLGKLCGTGKPGNGTSDVKLIKGPDQEVAFAFKSVDGESDMMGTPKGFGTAREVLMSKLTEKLGLGWPKVTMATLDNKSGALIEGVKGLKFNTDELAVDEVPAEALQKVLLTNLVGGQFDIKWEDVRFNMKDGKLEPTCMDGGAAMPDPATRANFLIGAGDGRPGQTIVTHPGHGGILDEAKKPMDPALVQKILAIDTRALRAELLQHAGELQTGHGLDTRALGLDTGIGTSIESIEGMQAILRDTQGRISLADFLARYHAEVIQAAFIAPARAAWERKQVDDYTTMVALHGELLEPLAGPQTSAQVQEIYLNFTHPENRQVLDKLVDLADPQGVDEMLKSYGYTMPRSMITPAFFELVEKVHKSIADGLSEYEKYQAKYPGLVEDKANFRSLAAAYAAVLTSPQRQALSRLLTMAADVSTKENATVSAADLMRRFGHPVPTSDFSRIAADVQARLKQQQAQQG